MKLTIGNWFRIGCSIQKRKRSRQKGWYFGAEFKLFRFFASFSFCSWIKREGWKIKRDIPLIPKELFRMYSWRKCTLMLGRELKQHEGRNLH